MNPRVNHLHEDRLYDCYLAGRTGDTLDPTLAVHLADCTACRDRYAEMTELFDAMRLEADEEADDVFTAERLRQQQAQVMHRIELVNRSAKVISFPGRVAHHVSGASTGRVAPRWLAASAAAGLFVGVAVGGFFSDASFRHQSVASLASEKKPSQAMPPLPVRPSTPVNAVNTIDDDAFLMELEFSLQRPHTRELQPFDALTPHVREIGSILR